MGLFENVFLFDLPGGLGNQIFAYFAALYMNQVTGEQTKLQYITTSKSHVGSQYDIRSFKLALQPITLNLPATFLSPIYFPKKNGFNRRISKVLSLSPVIEFNPGEDTKLHVDHFLMGHKQTFFPVRISGYFGDFSFYEALDSKDKLLQLAKPSSSYLKIRDNMKPSLSLGIHIRAGDYLNLHDSVGVLDDQYYLGALEQISNLTPAKSTLIFTNDAEYALKRIRNWNLENCLVISPELLPDPAESLDLMSRCMYIVTSNSTFSFWAAKLSSNNSMIWTPDNWRRDGLGSITNVPQRWHRVPSSWINLSN